MNWRISALIAGALVVLVGALVLAHASPIESVLLLLKGSLGSLSAIGGTLKEATPLLLAGLAVYVGLKAGLFNIGVEGQLVMGAMSCTVIALRVPGPTGVILGMLVGTLTGALWAIPAALIKAYRNGHEVITTIMLNWLAVKLTDYLTAGPIKSPTDQSATTAILADNTHLPSVLTIGNFELNIGLILGIALTIGISWWLRKTVAGYELRAVGANPIAARFAGVSTPKVTVWAMAASGAIAGLGGAVQVLAYEWRFFQGFSPGYGFDGLGVALLAGNSAVGVMPASLLFGILAKGSTALESNGVPRGITTVVLGLLVLIAAAIRYRKVKTVA